MILDCSQAEKNIIKNIMIVNHIWINKNVCMSNEIKQTNGVLQGSPLIPLLFNIATINAISAIQSDNRKTKIYAYADDTVMVSTSVQELQESFSDLVQGAEDNSLQTNVGKTEMVFRKGGKVRCEDRTVYGQERLNVVKCYKYQGITLQTSETALTMHIKEKTLSEMWATVDIQSLSKLLMDTAMNFFDLKIVRILMCGLALLRDHPGENHLKMLESVKVTHLKKTLRV
jgi:hypothetical protein